MKKYSTILFAIALLAVASCGKNVEQEAPEAPESEVIVDDVPEGLVLVSLKADLSEVSRASLDGAVVKWSEGDKILVYDGTSEREFTLTSGANTASGTFEGYVTEGADDIEALFPSNAGSWNGSSFDFDIPDIQDATTQSIDSKALIMTASGSVSTGLSFENAPALLRFSVGDGATRVIFHTLNGEKIAGNETSVIITVSGEGTYEAAINPISYAGIRAFVTNGSGTFLKEGVSTINLGAGEGLNMGTISSSTEVVAIATPAELQAFLGGTPALDAYLCKDLDLTDVNPGTLTSYANAFDGQGHILKNWTANAALFGTLSGSISNLTIGDSCTMGNPSSGNFGYLVNELTGSMVSCINEADINVTFADVTSQYIFGSLVGCSNAASAVMTDCVNNGDIDVEFDVPGAAAMQPAFIGGLVGKVDTESTALRMDGCVNNGSHFNVDVAAGTNSNLRSVYVGGIAGAAGLSSGAAAGYTSNYGTFDGCENNADLSVNYAGGNSGDDSGFFRVGGIIGYAECKLLECVNNGDASLAFNLSATNYSPAFGGVAGLLCGTANPNARNCSNYGAVTFTGNVKNHSNTAIQYGEGGGGTSAYYTFAGGCFGLVGDSSTLIDNCDNYGVINFTPVAPVSNASRIYFGGVVGRCLGTVSGCDNLYAGAQAMSCSNMNYTYVGGVAGVTGTNCSSISNCHNNASIALTRQNRSTGTATLSSLVGGVVGISATATSISNCENTGDITYNHLDTLANTIMIGGIVGRNDKASLALSSCVNSGRISVKGHHKYVADNATYIGGIIADSEKGLSISSCSNAGACSFDGENHRASDAMNIWLSGIIGYAGGAMTISGCTNEAALEAKNWKTGTIKNYIGGIYGGGYGSTSTISDCTNTGDITIDSGSGSYLHLGGICGALKGNINGCAQNADITANGTSRCKVGGLIGYHYGVGNFGDSTKGCSVSGSISTDCGSQSWTGGIAGVENATIISADPDVYVSWSYITINAAVSATAGQKGGLLGGIATVNGGNAANTLNLSNITYAGTTVNTAAISSSNYCGKKGTGTITAFDAL